MRANLAKEVADEASVTQTSGGPHEKAGARPNNTVRQVMGGAGAKMSAISAHVREDEVADEQACGLRRHGSDAAQYLRHYKDVVSRRPLWSIIAYTIVGGAKRA